MARKGIYQSINQSIDQLIIECIMLHGTRAKTGPKQHYIHKQTTHLHKKCLDDVSFTYYTVYKSVKGPKGIGS